ncbi:DUF2065 family protein [Halovulum sp. GXIMD14793]
MTLNDLILGLGFVAVFEGLVLALAPGRLSELLRILAELPVETRRWMGLGILLLGACLLWLAQT